ncbi:hypothetical protein VTN00DRAFT_2080 [Thermoascus crustaceus]|uniref:uncharacterized protein n=1 Tax=Thermoascus crustaceus TaxID=5088 RepID=UPI0037436B3C
MTTQAKNGLCPTPFLQENLFPRTGGFVDGRYCENITTSQGDISCCLPCPQAEWRYSDDLISKTFISSWINVAILPLSIFLLVTYAVLPPKWTHRHYLTICFTIGICLMEIAFIIPLGTKPNECYNEITPNDMRSDLSCAFTGSLLLFGGWAVVIWSFLRTIALHLQVCWEIIIGPKFMWGALIVGWGIPAIGLAVMLVLTGVSYRFGNVCHINHANSLQDYWIPLMVFAAIALVLQMTTLVYCVHVYVRSLFDNSPTTTNSSALPSYSGSVRTQTARQAYKRVQRVIQLQWRGIAVVFTIIGNVIFFAIVFISMDNSVKSSPETATKGRPWIICLALTQGDKEKCHSYTTDLGPNEATVLAVLILLSLSGMWNFIFVIRTSMLVGWVKFFKSKFVHSNEFVSADARGHLGDTRAYEMLSSSASHQLKMPEPTVTSTSPTDISSSKSRLSGGKSAEGGDYFGREAKYTSPAMSFSSPRPPSSAHGNYSRDWDARATFARPNPTYSHGNSYSYSSYRNS